MLKTRHKVAMARVLSKIAVAARRLVGGGPQLEVTRGGFKWHLDLLEGIDLAIYLFGVFERNTQKVYQRLLPAGAVVLDIGANIGAHTLHLARCTGPNGQVIAFEPTDFAFAKLQRNLSLNHEIENRVTLEQVMLVDLLGAKKPNRLYSSWPLQTENEIHPKLMGRLMSTDGASINTLDAYIKEAGISRVDFIKIDVDGHECAVLTGAMNTLRRDNPPLIMELSPYVLDEAGGSIERLTEIFSDLGYVFEHLDSGDLLPMDPAKLRSYIPDGIGINILARPHPVPA